MMRPLFRGCRGGFSFGSKTSAGPRTTRLGARRRHQHHQQQQQQQQRNNVTTIAIVKETYNAWERRAPLTPSNVRSLLESLNEGTGVGGGGGSQRLRILVEPCSRRIFSEAEYERAGAVVARDEGLLDGADIYLSVKRPRDDKSLRPDKTYAMFSHTIKGQEENMQLLETCLDRRVQLLDYERMMRPDDPAKRLVSFGRFAGMAGAIDSLAAVGRRLLYTHGISSPFLGCPPSYQYDSLDEAFGCVRKLGDRLRAAAASPSSAAAEPLVLAVTGKGGAVHGGVMEILNLLPHEVISVQDLHDLASNGSIAPAPIYVVPVDKQDVFVRCDGAAFDREDFYRHPSQYRCLFAQNVAPYVHVVYNCLYWDSRFPRLLTKSQIERLYRDGQKKLMLVADITCDVRGSVEFLEHTTTIESPFFQYDPISRKEVASQIRPDGVTVLGVDILPTELPRDASEHFGSRLCDVVKEIVEAREHQKEGARGVDPNLLSPSLANSVITTPNGALSGSYRYLRAVLERSLPRVAQLASNPSMLFSLEGHLFDSGLINQILDVIESKQAGIQFEECVFPQCSSVQPLAKSTVLLRVIADDHEKLKMIESKICALVDVIEKAQATIKRVDRQPSEKDFEEPWSTATEGARVPFPGPPREKRVLLLGAGLVSKTAVQFLGRSDQIRIVVASEREEDAKDAAAVAANQKGKHVALDISEDIHQLSELVEDSDLVISLLPAPMHPIIAQECILHKSHLVTASYESDEMRLLDERARDAGIIILNEVGLDPGLDHMSAMKIIDDIKARGGHITGFSSVCGGLPAPEAANNPLKYKFSWSPRGVIRACLNAARYRRGQQTVHIPGHELLRSAHPFTDDAWPDLQLECLPNRDSPLYEKVYDIEDVSTIFRGTLRYGGFSRLMHVFKNMGLFDEIVIEGNRTWADVIDALRMQRGGFASIQDFVEACADDNAQEAERAMEALEWLGLLSDERVAVGDRPVVDSFCAVLESKLRFDENERDMVLMHHTIEATFDDGTTEEHKSSLQVYGDSMASAMSKTVGFTTAASAELILNGSLEDKRGLLLPIEERVYVPVLAKVEQEGIRFEDSVSVHHPLVEEQNA